MALDNNQSDFIDIKGILKSYINKWYYFAISIIIMGLLGVVFVKIKKPVYQIKANVVLSQNEKSAGGALSAIAAMSDFGGLFGANADVEDEIFIISSHSVLTNVVKDLNLNIDHVVKTGLLSKMFRYQDFPVQVYPAPGIVDTLSYTVVFKIKANEDGKVDVTGKVRRQKIADVEDATFPITLDTEYGKYILDKTSYYPEGESVKTTIAVTGYGAAAEDLAEDITIEMASKKSNVIELGFQTPYPVFGEDIINKLIELYNERGIEVKRKDNENTAIFLQDRIALIEGELNSAEQSLLDYKEKHGIVDLTADAEYNFKVRAEAEQLLFTAQTEQEILKMTLDFLSNPQNAYSLLPITNEGGQGLSDALKTYNELILRRMSIANNAKQNNAALKQIEEQIDAMRAGILQSVEKAYANSQVAVRDLQQQANKAISKLGNIPAQERDYLALLRQQSVKQELYLYLLKSQEETAMMIANSKPNAEIIDEAYTLKEPLGLGKLVWLAIFLMLGVCIPPVIIYLQKLMSDKFASKEDLDGQNDLPVLGEVAVDKDGDTLLIAQHADAPEAEQYRLVRTNLKYILGNNDKVVLFTSANAGEGKAIVAINVASSLAMLKKRVLLIGMDIRNPKIAEYLHLPANKGLSQYLDDQLSLRDIIQKEPIMPNLDIIVAGPAPKYPAELLHSDNLDKMMEELKDAYDYIIIDSAPVGTVSDTFTLDRISDATVFVCRVNFSTIKDIRFFNSIAKDQRLKNASLIVNETPVKKGEENEL